MSAIFDCSDPSQLLAGTRQARQAIARGELIVVPTDTVYGVAADAFSPGAVQRLLDAKGRTRQTPPPVLVASKEALGALAATVPEVVQRLIDAFWPGGLTVILPVQPSVQWDLGETRGTVAVRMPDHTMVRELLEETGPLATSSANLTGEPAATSVVQAVDMLGESVGVYLDDGPVAVGMPSSIVDATGLSLGTSESIRLLREGAISLARIREVAGDVAVTAAWEEPAQGSAASVGGITSEGAATASDGEGGSALAEPAATESEGEIVPPHEGPDDDARYDGAPQVRQDDADEPAGGDAGDGTSSA